MVGCQSCTCSSIHFFHGADSEDHGRLPDEHMSKHSPSDGAHSQDHGRLFIVHVSQHSHKHVHTCWTPSGTIGRAMHRTKKTSVMANKLHPKGFFIYGFG